VELDKVLLNNLRELSRFFNDHTALDQYQVRLALSTLQALPHILSL
jgi:hypothetical protein